MKKILILKTGSTFPEVRKRLGDFEDWIINSSTLARESFVINDCKLVKNNPNPANFAGMIITGSHENVTDSADWMIELQEFLRTAESKGIPILGICFGHQILAAAFGGMVDFSPLGQELGSKVIRETETGKADPIFKAIPEQFIANESHAQEVLRLPNNARLLAENSHSTVQAMVIGDRTWGVQFHPEFGRAETQVYFDAEKQNLSEEQINQIRIHETPVSRSIIQRFIDFALSHSAITYAALNRTVR